MKFTQIWYKFQSYKPQDKFCFEKYFYLDVFQYYETLSEKLCYIFLICKFHGKSG